MPIQFGFGTPQYASWAQMVERWRHIEELGFDCIWIPDHFVQHSPPTTPWFEAWTLLAGLATETSRIRLGTLVTAIPFRNPAFLAHQALTVDHLSRGRLELGLRAGWPGEVDPCYSMTGTEDWPPRERVARFREAVEVVDQLLRNEVTTYHGRYYQLREAAMQPRPIQRPRPPITIAARGSAMLRIAAHHADAWNSLFGGPEPSLAEKLKLTRRRMSLLEDYCKEVGRDLSTLRRSLSVYPDTQAVYSSVDAFEEFVKRQGDAGINEFILMYPEADEQLEIFERIAEDAIPKLRG